MTTKVSFAAVMVAAVFVAALTSGTSAQGKGKPGPSPVPVVATVYDTDASGLGVLLQSDGAGQASYGAGDLDVLSQIWGGNGDWELNLSAQQSRTVDLTFLPVPGSPNAPVPNGPYNARLISRCFDSAGNITGFLQIAEGAFNDRCSLRVNFSAGGKDYFFVMSPPYQGTGWATVTCTELPGADIDTDCDGWTIVPGAGSNTTVANLYEVGKAGREILKGSYYNTFRIDVAR
jgi:hypothetical protein